MLERDIHPLWTNVPYHCQNNEIWRSTLEISWYKKKGLLVLLDIKTILNMREKFIFSSFKSHNLKKTWGEGIDKVDPWTICNEGVHACVCALHLSLRHIVSFLRHRLRTSNESSIDIFPFHNLQFLHLTGLTIASYFNTKKRISSSFITNNTFFFFLAVHK